MEAKAPEKGRPDVPKVIKAKAQKEKTYKHFVCNACGYEYEAALPTYEVTCGGKCRETKKGNLNRMRGVK